MTTRSGRHFLQLPGPTNVPERVRRAMDRAVIDHRGPEFAELTLAVLEDLKPVFRTDGTVFVFPSSATGAWEAALVNTLAPGDGVLAFDRGFFAGKWAEVATRLGLDVDLVPGDWRAGVEPQLVEDRLRRDRHGRIRAVMVVHNETSTGVTTNIPDIRAAIDAAGHPAYFMVDTVSSLASIDFRHDEWGVDVTVTGSQKGLMLPPGLGFTAASERALAARAASSLPHSYFSWDDQLAANAHGFFPYTPATTLLFGLRESLAMLAEEGLDHVFARHRRFAEATRAAVAAWGLECYSIKPCEHSNSLTAVLLPDGHDANDLRGVILERFDMSLGTGLGKLDGRVFRIGHLGDLNELTLAGTLAGVEMGLRLARVPHSSGGVDAALDHLAMTHE
ncbi:MAG: aminotransferase class V-fold PLP-dependent enzyme [Gammaproteobacteria bacterium]|nr:aminotransferase class V-fold PLP-dependent enzyme [Gammaproteobacteria bacterium]MDE0650419.1 aminotransferase class V-fold PLP-dependent enzyme [Gammaproteobacteria bacterium]